MSLLVLSNEILLQIFSEHDILSTKDYVHLIHVCKRVYHLALPQLYYTVTLSWGGEYDRPVEDHEEFARRLKSHSAHAAWVRSASVLWTQDESLLTDSMFATLLSFSFLENLSLNGIASLEFFRNFNLPLPPPPWQNSAFLSFVERCSELTALESLDIEYRKLRVHELVKLYSIPGLKCLRCYKFDDGLDYLYTSAESLSPLDCTTITHLEFWYSSQPEGLFAEYLLAPHPKLENLVWVIETGNRMPAVSAGGYLKAFGSHTFRLTRLHLSYTNSELLKGGLEMDFKPFVVLKELDVHHRLIFGEHFPSWIGANKSTERDTIVERLPVLLECLTITFDCGSSILESKPSNSADYNWILVLGQHKKASFTHLSRVVLLEREGWEYMASSVIEDAAKPLVYPEDVQDLYDEARIFLLGFSRAKIF